MPNVHVFANQYDCCGGGNGSQTDINGDYVINGLIPGEYRVEAHPQTGSLVGEFFASTSNWNLAARVAVSAGTTTPDIDFSLDGGGSISGRVTRESDGSPVANADVWANTFDCCGGGNGTRSDANGDYTIDGLAPGAYRVEVNAFGQDLVREFFPSTTNWSAATAVNVLAGQDTPNIDFTLVGGGSISGIVYVANSSSTPLAGANVWASDFDGTGGHGWARSRADGSYTIEGLAGGQHRVEAQYEGLVHKIYDDTTQWDQATPVAVADGVDTPNIDFTLVSGGRITGTVYDSSMTPVARASIHANSYDGQGGWGWAQTRTDGTYEVTGLSSGDYRVQADASDQGLTQQFYSSTADWGLAARVSVAVGSTTPEINFILSSGGSIAGTVTDEATGLPIFGADVWAEVFDCCGGGNGTRTRLDGTYVISGLAPGNYRVQANVWDSAYVGEFFAGTSDWGQATPVTVGADTTTPDIDFSLTTGGSISGLIFDEATGLPIANADVWADTYDCCGGGGWTRSNLDGTYTIDCLSTGDFRVTAQADDQGYVREFYASTTGWHLAMRVAVTSSQDTSNIDFSLVSGGSISSRVTRESDGTPVADADVWADSYDCCGGGNGARTDSNGNYVIEGLNTGDYRVQVRADQHGLVGNFFPTTTDWAQASRVTVGAGTTTPNIDFTLPGGGSISGNVTESDGVTPIANANVSAFGTAGWGHGQTDGNGDYSIGGLASGDYRVEADAADRGFVREFYDNTVDFNSATLVAVTAGADSPNIDFALDNGGSISGTVYDVDGVTPLGGIDISAFSNTGGGGHTRSQPDGTYIIEGLSTSSYRVQADASILGYSIQFYSSTPAYNLATLVPVVTGSDTPDIDFVMEAGGSIAGTVVTANPGDPIANVDVWANPYDGGGGGGGRGARTDANGDYEIQGLASGDYRVRAQKPDAGLVGEFFDNTNDWGQATRVAVVAGQVTPNIDFDLGGGGSISGTIYAGNTSTPLAGADVWAEVFDCCGGGNGNFSAVDGTYTITGLAPGDYRVRAQKNGFSFEYYDNTVGYDSSTRVTVVAGVDTPNIDFVLDQAGSISGKVTQADGVTPMPNVNVWAENFGSGGGNGTQTAADGTYTIQSLPAGSYRVRADGPGFVEEFWQNTPVHASATAVVVVGGADTPSIDFTLEPGGSISGIVVTANPGAPIPNAHVQAFSPSLGINRGTNTAGDGTYTIDGLPSASDYEVRASAPGFIDEYWQEVANRASSMPVTVVVGSPTPNIDFTLASGGSISGSVVTANPGAPIPNIHVQAFSPSLNFNRGADTEADGTYTIDGLPPAADYEVRAGGQGSGYVKEYWQEVAAQASSTPVVVVAGADTSGIDFTLTAAGSISGKVTEVGGVTPIADADVWAQPPGGNPVKGTKSAADGTYTLNIGLVHTRSARPNRASLSSSGRR